MTVPDDERSAFAELPHLERRGQPTVAFGGPLILVVDDDPDARALWSECLSHLGYRTATESNGADGLRTALHDRPLAILMDLSMPRMSGLEATRRIKASPATRNCLVIVVTAYGPAMFSEARAAGCDAYFSKPFDAFLLDGILRAFRTPGGGAHRSEIVRRCHCRRTYTRDTWTTLRLYGRMHIPNVRGVLEVRNCVCGGCIVMPVEHPSHGPSRAAQSGGGGD
jgi:CheY-like chemotaxis protein